MTPVVMIWWLLNEKILLKGYLGLCCEENDDVATKVSSSFLCLYVKRHFLFSSWVGVIKSQLKVRLKGTNLVWLIQTRIKIFVHDVNPELDKNDVLLHGAGDKTDYCQPMLCCECWWRARLRRGGTRTGFMMMVSWKIMKIGCWPWLGRIGGATIIYSFQKLSF